MNLMESTYRTLVVSSSSQFTEKISTILADNHLYPVTVCDGASARRAVLEEAYDVVIINTPLPDEFGTKLSLDLASISGVGVLLLVKAEHFAETNSRVLQSGVMTVSKPTNPNILAQSLIILCATRERLRRMEQKTASIEEKMEEIRIVNRAKWILIEQLKMTEPDAHRYIEKSAMDRCRTKREIAESILKTYQ